MTDIEALVAENAGIKLDIGCGANKQDGFVGLDVRPLPNVDIVHDILVRPWPLPDECVLVAVAAHLVEHIPPHDFQFVKFMDEVWRVMKPYGQFAIVTPHGMSQGYIQDPTHCNPCNERTWDYFCPEQPSGLWNFYQPKPWRLRTDPPVGHPAGNMELVLIKLPENWNE